MMNLEIGAEAALFPEKEYINGIFVAVQAKRSSTQSKCQTPTLRNIWLVKKRKCQLSLNVQNVKVSKRKQIFQNIKKS